MTGGLTRADRLPRLLVITLMDSGEAALRSESGWHGPESRPRGAARPPRPGGSERAKKVSVTSKKSNVRAVKKSLRIKVSLDYRRGGCRKVGPGRRVAHLALLYALVHDHRDYARYLLGRYSVSALRASRCSFCCHRSSSSPHLSVAVRYNRVSILSMMVEALKDCDVQGGQRDYLDGCGGCSHVADSGKTAVELAVELSRPDCLLLLLAHGAQPDGLDAALQRLVSSDVTERRHAQRCLDFLLLYLPKPPALRHLQEEPQRWQSLLGNEVFSWLCGLAPPPLLLQALRCLARSGPDGIAALPDFLQLHSWQ
ncbi:ankyrin repeat domain-containing protein 9-like [Morone saxatilis]|uniref:ankyrin repeat domain-containing protein 9-like n=1 Tax=Morone saxatilis TaxID=34816 RepID=UPI0015E23AEE|nr:ankyrin repeat domain-containing protein 9-like [Morone saxatilis]